MTDRMFRIHGLIAAGKYPNAVTMAQQFEASVKTIKRDLLFMQLNHLLPLEYDAKRHGYYYTQRVEKFPGTASMTEAEMFALLVADKAVEQYQGTPFHQPLHLAFQKLSGQLDQKARYSLQDYESLLSFKPFAPELTDLKAFAVVTQALQRKLSLRFDYRKPGEKNPEWREMDPYHLNNNDNRWYSSVGFQLGRISAPSWSRAFAGKFWWANASNKGHLISKLI